MTAKPLCKLIGLEPEVLFKGFNMNVLAKDVAIKKTNFAGTPPALVESVMSSNSNTIVKRQISFATLSKCGRGFREILEICRVACGSVSASRLVGDAKTGQTDPR